MKQYKAQWGTVSVQFMADSEENAWKQAKELAKELHREGVELVLTLDGKRLQPKENKTKAKE